MIATVLMPAHAITLGEIAVHSPLGQPLNATVPVQIAQGEYLGASCVTAPASADTQIGGLRQVNIKVPETAMAGTHQIQLTTLGRLYEPMYELQLQVRCPGTPLVLRQYVLMLDLPGTLAEPAATPAAGVAPALTAPAADLASAAAPPAPTARTARAVPRLPAPAPVGSPIAPGSRYQVSKGDTLFGIARRVRERAGASVWAFAEQIFAANPGAFVAGNADLIKLGAEIEIPGTAVGAPVAAAAEVTPATTVPATQTAAPVAAAPVTDAPLSATESAAVTQTNAPVATAAASRPPAVAATPRAAPKTAARRATEGGSNSWYLVGLAIAAGLGLGLLTLRRRLVDAFRDLLARRAARGTPVTAVANPGLASASANAAPARAEFFARNGESTMVVEETPRETRAEAPIEVTGSNWENPEPTTRTNALATSDKPRPATGDLELDVELDKLFADEHAFALPDGLDTPGGMAEFDLDLDLTDAAPESPVDLAPSRAQGDTSPPSRRATDGPVAPAEDTAEHLDLQSLASSAEGDEKLSQTLMEALTLLERDYEAELTASQIVDLSQLPANTLEPPTAEDARARTGTGSQRRR
jgi:LysM repeat protein